jgi:hypothetical protein
VKAGALWKLWPDQELRGAALGDRPPAGVPAQEWKAGAAAPGRLPAPTPEGERNDGAVLQLLRLEPWACPKDWLLTAGLPEPKVALEPMAEPVVVILPGAPPSLPRLAGVLWKFARDHCPIDPVGAAGCPKKLVWPLASWCQTAGLLPWKEWPSW